MCAVSDICMMCFDRALDGIDLSQWHTDGISWVYCAKCDCWTEHPVTEEID